MCTPANWKQGDDVIVDVSLTDASAEETFDKVCTARTVANENDC